jgi:hypothetical protein
MLTKYYQKYGSYPKLQIKSNNILLNIQNVTVRKIRHHEFQSTPHMLPNAFPNMKTVIRDTVSRLSLAEAKSVWSRSSDFTRLLFDTPKAERFNMSSYLLPPVQYTDCQTLKVLQTHSFIMALN